MICYNYKELRRSLQKTFVNMKAIKGLSQKYAVHKYICEIVVSTVAIKNPFM